MSDSIQNAVTNILVEIGEDPTRDGLRKTPGRVAKSFAYLTSGYQQTLTEVVNDAIFDVDYNEMIVVRDIDFYSLCEHHLLPFYGKAQVAYLPRKKIIGLSKIPRIVEMFARRLQVQERLTNQVAHALQDAIDPHGVAVVIEAYHLCAAMRGVEKQNCFMSTSSMLGSFLDEQRTRNEFLQIIARK